MHICCDCQPSHVDIHMHFVSKGAWRPSLNISTVLTSIQLLMTEPNPDDPLMADIVSFTLPSVFKGQVCKFWN